jgi:deazaflavin-dependent oxidoreductase (nitroreductase family)
MAIEIPPPGTRGAQPPRLPPALISAVLHALTVVYRLFGRWLRIDGKPIVLLTTVGAKTGKRRQTLLLGFPWGEDRWLVLASSMGMARNPAWLFNLARNPDHVTIEVGGRQIAVRAETLAGAERDEAWERIIAQSARFGGYQQKTDRVIPIIRLARVDGA